MSAETVVDYLMACGWNESQRSATAGPAREFVHGQHIGSVGVIAPYSKDFCQTCNRLRVSSAGKLHLCLFGEEGYDLLPHIDDNDPVRLDLAVAQFLGYKADSHYLSDGHSGHTANLSMFGG